MTSERSDTADTATLAVPNEPKAIDDAQARLVASLERFEYPKASLFAIRLSLHEAMSNAFLHGHRNLPGVPVSLEFEVDPDHVVITVQDQGEGFDPASVPDPTLDENIERGCGRGLLLIRAYMTSAEYNRKGNSLRMTYARPPRAR